MKQFDHPHIIKLIGVCMDEEFYIVMELAVYGEVKRTSNLFLCYTTLWHWLFFVFWLFLDEVISSKE